MKNKTVNEKQANIFMALLCFLLLCTLPVQAQLGRGAAGGNRRVDIRGGYGGVYGSFDIIDMNLPPNNNTPSKPTVYFGCEIQVHPPNAEPQNVLQVDAGYVWEPIYIRPSDGEVFSAGWALFLRIDDNDPNDYDNIHPQGNDQRIPGESLGSPHFGFSVRTGQVELSYPNPWYRHPWDASYLYYFHSTNYPAHLTSTMTAKRVIGISQDTGVTFDNSSMTGRFFDGEVAEIRRDNQGNISLVNRRTWPLEGTQFSLTPGRDDAGNFIVDFPPPYTRLITGNDPPLTQTLREFRCHEETVNVNLMTSTHIVGLSVTSATG